MIRLCTDSDVPEISAIVNDAARAYHGVIPADRWHQPYMPVKELKDEIAAGVHFWGWEDGNQLNGIMGMQSVKDVTLIRHAYVRTAMRNQGIGGKLLAHLLGQASGKILVGTWKAADWAIRFYQKHGFDLVTEEEKDRLLKIYWNIPARQIETSVVLIHRPLCKSSHSP
ncbi:MAG TPA: GNAT family N-acetyltransferase [Verrucomicrobiae bacterium]|nr:GNAT family N-acetyltransferase [Verrucomicrobiae bacterium]